MQHAYDRAASRRNRQSTANHADERLSQRTAGADDAPLDHRMLYAGVWHSPGAASARTRICSVITLPSVAGGSAFRRNPGWLQSAAAIRLWTIAPSLPLHTRLKRHTPGSILHQYYLLSCLLLAMVVCCQ
jgi:hypothetical protein